MKKLKRQSHLLEQNRSKVDKNKAKDHTFVVNSDVFNTQSNAIKVKPFFLMQKITSNRDIIKISHIGNFTNEEIKGMTGVKFSKENYERNDLYNDSNDCQMYETFNNINKTPTINNLSQEENIPMKEIKLFSRIDNQHCNKAYFSNKVIAKNLCNPGNSAKSNIFNNASSGEHNISAQMRIAESANENLIQSNKLNFNGILSSKDSDQDDSPDSCGKYIKRHDLTSWGGFDIISAQNTNFQNFEKGRSRGSINRKGKEYIGYKGRTKQTFNDCFDDNEKEAGANDSRVCRSRLENESKCINPAYNYQNYNTKIDSTNVKKKAMKSNSYSPAKCRGVRREDRSRIHKNLNETEYQDDQFFFDNSNLIISDMNQTQDNVNVYTNVSKRSRKKKLLEKVESPDKQMMKVNTNSRNTKNNIVINSAGIQNLNFKSKFKKRLKFTMRNDKNQKYYGPRPTQQNKVFEINDIVSIIGINNRLQTTMNHNPRQQNDTIEDQKRTKSENRCINKGRSEVNNYDFSHYQTSSQKFKNNCIHQSDSCSPEKEPQFLNFLQPPLIQNQQNSTVIKKFQQCRTQSQAGHIFQPDPNMEIINQCLSETSSRINSKHKMHKSKCQIITECRGSKVNMKTQTKRICMKRREEMQNAPLLIINFDGVIGSTKCGNTHIDNLCKPESYYRQTNDDDVVLRQGANKNLMFLMGSFQIVLFLSKYRKKQDSIINILENKVGDVFDSIYTRLSYKNDNRVIDYSQIYEDFNIQDHEIENKVMVVCPINLEPEEVKDRSREELLFIDDNQNCTYKDLIASCIPMNSTEHCNPLSILVTAISTQSSKMVPFAKLTKFLNLMINAYEDDAPKISESNNFQEEFSFVKCFKTLQKMITKNNISSLK